ncbi:AAA family ATPase [Pedobacter africanus]|uniref:Predicted ATPase n=1 Tax=Pedobacter africanus TaxID=151894 RepID=A0A1W2E403_9SPHI|nr:AAA family ATPase [Pedobacter africanus]SMD04132.1 Predicted ATPase [Pedobacter africanus]
MLPVIKDNFYVITGGPGMGKTTLLTELEFLNYTCVEESGRKIIIDELKRGGKALPWEDQALFARAMFAYAVNDFKAHEASITPVFFDRGIPDVIGYLRLCGLPVPDGMLRAAKVLRYNKKVFVTPPWAEIYRNDTERKQPFGEAVATCEVMKTVYADLGYLLVELPKCPASERANFIIGQMG